MPGRYTLEGVNIFMNLLERVLTLLGANLNTMIEKADDPEKVLRQLQLDMRNQLVQVKTQVATAISESHKLQKRSKEKVAEAEAWLKKAEQAVQQNNDTAARTALTHYNDILKQANRYQLSEDQVIERQMRDLKAKNKPLRDLPLLHEGKPEPSPLLPPQPQANAPVKKVAQGDKGAKGEPEVPVDTTGITEAGKEQDLKTELKKLFD